jgi:hypothetical protein
MKNKTSVVRPLKSIPICAVPLSGVSDRPALSVRLLTTDMAVSRLQTVQYLADFAKQRVKDVMFGVGSEEQIESIIASAKQYAANVSYNPEGIDPAEILARTTEIYATVKEAGLSLSLGVVYANFLKYYASYEPISDIQAVQLQRCHKGDAVRLATEAVSLVRSVTPLAKIRVQICSYSPNVYGETYTAQEIATVVKDLQRVSGVAGVYLYFGGPEQYPLCWEAIKLLRPIAVTE